ncbi:MAG: hypothetical protein ACI8S6_002894 [Myxococcota bacterium]
MLLWEDLRAAVVVIARRDGDGLQGAGVEDRQVEQRPGAFDGRLLVEVEAGDQPGSLLAELAVGDAEEGPARLWIDAQAAAADRSRGRPGEGAVDPVVEEALLAALVRPAGSDDHVPGRSARVSAAGDAPARTSERRPSARRKSFSVRGREAWQVSRKKVTFVCGACASSAAAISA